MCFLFDRSVSDSPTIRICSPSLPPLPSLPSPATLPPSLPPSSPGNTTYLSLASLTSVTLHPLHDPQLDHCLFERKLGLCGNQISIEAAYRYLGGGGDGSLGSSA